MRNFVFIEIDYRTKPEINKRNIIRVFSVGTPRQSVQILVYIVDRDNYGITRRSDVPGLSRKRFFMLCSYI